MKKDFQITDKPRKKLNRIYRRISKKTTPEDFQYIKNKIKEASNPLEEVKDLLENADRIYTRDAKWSMYGMWGLILIIFIFLGIAASIRGTHIIYDSMSKIFITLAICVANMMGIKAMSKRVYEYNTECLKKIRVELEKEQKK